MDVDVVFVMGVCGSGKSTVGAEIARRLGWAYKDGDDFHSEAKVAKMSAGVPLSDEDRQPWLKAMNEYCRSHPQTVLGCSALKKQYREVLKTEIRCRFVFLNVSRQELIRRLNERKGHYMPSSLLDSQLTTLEPPNGEKNVLTIDIHQETSDDVIEIIMKRLNEV
ncbi:shikimate kinase [Oesophagostomum dentatum]|uniref:Gluconokinase n=1 Tax=Oesophagostomum dentatum TaxID=61180 RepID=A0A0B1SN44_OESDE|nr:shikimate kinase [Oesophagostomum dentatum]